MKTLENIRRTKVKIGDDGIDLNELLFISRIKYSLPNKANHVKVEDHIPPRPPTSLSIPLYPIYPL